MTCDLAAERSMRPSLDDLPVATEHASTMSLSRNEGFRTWAFGSATNVLLRTLSYRADGEDIKTVARPETISLEEGRSGKVDSVFTPSVAVRADAKTLLAGCYDSLSAEKASNNHQRRRDR